MKKFNLPSELFRYCLSKTSSGSNKYSYEACFPKYLADSDLDGYLWRSYDRRLDPLINQLKQSQTHSLSVLEVGCGFGHDLTFAAHLGANATGIDVNSEFVEISKKTKAFIEQHTDSPVNLNIKRSNILDMKDEKFDFIFMKDVFHHLEPREKVCNKIVSLLKPGGGILIVEPNAHNPLIQLQMFRIRGFNTIIEKIDQNTGERYLFGNERLISGKSLVRLFNQYGISGSFSNIRLLPTRFSRNKLLTRVAYKLEKSGLEKFFNSLCIHTIFYGNKEIRK